MVQALPSSLYMIVPFHPPATKRDSESLQATS